MTAMLYLDTARLGMMTPAAERVAHEYLRLAAAEGASPLADTLLHHGYLAWPPETQQRFPDFTAWGGLDALRHSLRQWALAPPDCPVLLANRSSQLMQLAARLLTRLRRRILTTDLEWPAYAAILARECDRRGRVLIQVPLRERILQEGCSAEEVARAVALAAGEHECDGAFLSAVTYEGFRLPVELMAALLPEAAYPPFIVIDGAQALGHASVNLAGTACDLYLGGCHKWLGAHQLLGVGICPRPRSQGIITTFLEEMLTEGELDDPLLHLTDCWRRGQRPRFTETVSLSPLFTAAAVTAESEISAERFTRLRDTALALERVGAETGWPPLAPHESLRSGIVLLKGMRLESPDELRRRFYAAGVTLTTYEGGILRVAAPPRGLGAAGRERFRVVLTRCS